jgi:hypothetical protein
MMNVILSPMLQQQGLGDGSVANVKDIIDNARNPLAANVVQRALDRLFGVFALIMTSVGIPMSLGGRGIRRCS